jgi:hypothetical protein
MLNRSIDGGKAVSGTLSVTVYVVLDDLLLTSLFALLCLNINSQSRFGYNGIIGPRPHRR